MSSPKAEAPSKIASRSIDSPSTSLAIGTTGAASDTIGGGTSATEFVGTGSLIGTILSGASATGGVEGAGALGEPPLRNVAIKAAMSIFDGKLSGKLNCGLASPSFETGLSTAPSNAIALCISGAVRLNMGGAFMLNGVTTVSPIFTSISEPMPAAANVVGGRGSAARTAASTWADAMRGLVFSPTSWTIVTGPMANLSCIFTLLCVRFSDLPIFSRRHELQTDMNRDVPTFPYGDI